MINQSKIDELKKLVTEFLNVSPSDKGKLSQLEDQIDRFILTWFKEIEKDATSLADQEIDPLEKLTQAKEAASTLVLIRDYWAAAKTLKAREAGISTKSKKVFKS